MNIDNRRIISHLIGKVKRKRKKINKIKQIFLIFSKKLLTNVLKRDIIIKRLRKHIVVSDAAE